jgi:hypothetical protein
MSKEIASVSKCKGCPYFYMSKGDRHIHIKCNYPQRGKECPLINKTVYVEEIHEKEKNRAASE